MNSLSLPLVGPTHLSDAALRELLHAHAPARAPDLLPELLTFVADNSTTQIFFALLVSLAALVLTIHFRPYTRTSMDVLLSTSQMCTLLTLVASLGLKTGIIDEGIVGEGFLSTLLVVLQVAPIIVVIALVGYSFIPYRRKILHRRHRRASRPGVVKDE